MLIVTAPVATSAAPTNERTTELSVTRFEPIYYLVDATTRYGFTGFHAP